MKTTMKKSARFLVVSCCLLVVSTLLMWLVASGFGNTRIQRNKIPAENGKMQSYMSWTPASATNENPAPAVVIFPGRTSNGEMMSYWGMEFSRRGYVTICADWDGNGESEVMSGNEPYVVSVMNSILKIPYIDPEHIVFVGCSAGNGALAIADDLYPDNIVGLIQNIHPRLIGDTPEDMNTLLIHARSDQYVLNFVGDEDAVKAAVTEKWHLNTLIEDGVLYGSKEDGTLRQFVVTNGIHQSNQIDTEAIAAAIEFSAIVAPTNTTLSSSNQHVFLLMLLQIIAYAALILFVLAFGSTLYENVPYFNEIGNEITPNKGLRGGALARNAVIAFLISLISFIPVSFLAHNYTGFLTPLIKSQNLRGIYGWLLFNAFVTLIIIFVQKKKKEKAGIEVSAADLGLAGEGESVSFQRVWRAFLLAVIVVGVLYAWVAIIEGSLGLNYQIWCVFNISEVTSARFSVVVWATVCTFIMMFAANIGMNTTRRLEESGKHSLAKQILLNVAVSAGAVTLLLLLQYGIGYITGIYMFPQLTNLQGGTSAGSLDFSFGFPLIMSFSAIISTYFFRKTHNIWIGTFISAMLGAAVGVMSSAFIA